MTIYEKRAIVPTRKEIKAEIIGLPTAPASLELIATWVGKAAPSRSANAIRM
jgi:hypothetical protein